MHAWTAHSRCLLLALALPDVAAGQADWPGWRGPGGNGVYAGDRLPARWDARTNVLWSAPIPGEGASSPIIAGGRAFVTSAADLGRRRSVHCLDAATGALLWTRTVEDDAPELASSVTGHAAPTPAASGDRVVAFFGNAGAVCHDAGGALLWRRRLGPFESELGLAASPVIHRGRVIIACDHDGDRFTSFDSFLTALDLRTGEPVWKTERPDVFRSWSTPLVVPAGGKDEIALSAQGEVRGHDPATGEILWRIRGLTDWLVPSPVFADGLLFVGGGKEGPVLAARPGGRGDVTDTHVAWKQEREGSYVTSPLHHDGRVYVILENGVLTAWRAKTGERLFRERLEGKFTASPIAGAGMVYFTSEDGATHVIRAADAFELVARNDLGEYTIASPAAAGGRIFIRTERRLHAIGERPAGRPEDRPPAPRAAAERAAAYLAREVPRWSRENRCFSCHNDGDGSRALFAARGAAIPVPDDSWKATAAWIARPEGWAKQAASEDFDDPKLARLQFAGALLAALESGAVSDRTPLARAARAVARDQLEDGSWRGGSENAVGSPTAYSRHLATHVGRSILGGARDPALDDRLRRAGDWLRARPPANVHQAAVLLMASAPGGDFPGEARLSESLALIRAGRSPDGGWGPYATSPPEAFDTALVLLGLARVRAALEAGGSGGSGKERLAEVDAWIRSGREHLRTAQEPDGGWPATTRPPGAESYAQRVSTTAWAALALLATR